MGNIDQVAVGTGGAFLIETKARRRRASRNGPPDGESYLTQHFLRLNLT